MNVIYVIIIYMEILSKKPLHMQQRGTCVIDGCSGKSRYGTSRAIALYCSRHKRSIEKNTFEISHPPCVCLKRARYGFPAKGGISIGYVKGEPYFGFGIPTHCADCKEPGMVNLIMGKCTVQSCKRSYNISRKNPLKSICRFHEIQLNRNHEIQLNKHYASPGL